MKEVLEHFQKRNDRLIDFLDKQHLHNSMWIVRLNAKMKLMRQYDLIAHAVNKGII